MRAQSLLSRSWHNWLETPSKLERHYLAVTCGRCRHQCAVSDPARPGVPRGTLSYFANAWPRVPYSMPRQCLGVCPAARHPECTVGTVIVHSGCSAQPPVPHAASAWRHTVRHSLCRLGYRGPLTAGNHTGWMVPDDAPNAPMPCSECFAAVSPVVRHHFPETCYEVRKPATAHHNAKAHRRAGTLPRPLALALRLCSNAAAQA